MIVTPHSELVKIYVEETCIVGWFVSFNSQCILI